MYVSRIHRAYIYVQYQAEIVCTPLLVTYWPVITQVSYVTISIVYSNVTDLSNYVTIHYADSNVITQVSYVTISIVYSTLCQQLSGL